MSQQPQLGWDERDRQISELEAELDCADRTITQLQQQNTQLQEQIDYLLSDSRQQSRIFQEEVSVNSAKPKYVRKKGSKQSSMLLAKRRFNKLSQLQIAIVAALVAAGFTSIGLITTRGLDRHHPIEPSVPSVIPSTSVPELPISSASPSIPSAISVPSQKKAPAPLSFSPFPQPQLQQPSSELVYNVQTPPNFYPSQGLQTIVNEVVDIAENKGLPAEALSVTLINVKTGESAGYKQQLGQFPASVVKLFWLVNFYDRVEQGIIPNEAAYQSDLFKMIQQSDNEAASRIVDTITNTKSGGELKEDKFKTWLTQRQQLNRFFQGAGYEGINVSQKTFPIPFLKLYKPEGRELQMRGNPDRPIRNKISTQQAARLLYEIVTSQSVSEKSSEKMRNLLTLDPITRAVKKEQNDPDRFNPVRGFFSQSLPEDVYFVAKSGWTSNSRQEAAYIQTADGKAAYILVIFAENRAYAYDWKIFPKISSHVFNRMVNFQ